MGMGLIASLSACGHTFDWKGDPALGLDGLLALAALLWNIATVIVGAILAASLVIARRLASGRILRPLRASAIAAVAFSIILPLLALLFSTKPFAILGEKSREAIFAITTSCLVATLPVFLTTPALRPAAE